MIRSVTLLSTLLVSVSATSIATAQQNPLSFQEISDVLGGQNLARTKDAEIADVDNDGDLDILDVNSNNSLNGTSVVLRLNNSNGGFTPVAIPDDTNTTTYDGDLVDLDGDNLPDLIRTEAVNGVGSVAVYLNQGAAGGWFNLNASPAFEFAMCADDTAFGDLNNDGLVDFVAGERDGVGACSAQNTSRAVVFINNGGGDFTVAQNIVTQNGVSTHDVFLFDANNNNLLDLLVVNETGGVNTSRLYFNNGGASPTFTQASQTFRTGVAGDAADLNNDGLDDFVLAGGIGGDLHVTAYINDAANPGAFTQTNLAIPAGAGAYYDVEFGDVDLDGDTDFMTASITQNNIGLQYWQNNLSTPGGPADFTRIATLNGGPVFPGHGNFQRLSADLIDFDQDGDLDVYAAGGDGQNLGCFGCVPNEFFENQIDPPPAAPDASRIVVAPLNGFTIIPIAKE